MNIDFCFFVSASFVTIVEMVFFCMHSLNKNDWQLDLSANVWDCIGYKEKRSFFFLLLRYNFSLE